MKSTKLLQRFLLFGLTMFLFLSAGCGGRGIETERSTESPPIDTENIEQSKNQPPIESAYHHYYDEDEGCPQPESTQNRSGTAKDGYVEGQLVLTGNPDDLENVAGAFPGTLVEQLEVIDLPTIDGGALGDFQIRLYKLVESKSVWEAVGEINSHIFDEKLEYAFAEPNYITGNPCRGCSGGILGAPGTTVVGTLSNPENQFLNQWAFNGHSGIVGDIGLYNQNNQWAATNVTNDPYTGQDIEIAIFDTVPSNFNEGLGLIDWASVPFDLCVWKPGLMIGPKNLAGVGDIDIQDHGIFVTGLAQGVAPGARYFLIESLNADARGDIVSLLFGMNEYADYRRASNGSLNKTVINLSLGLEIEHILINAPDEVSEALASLQALLQQVGWSYNEGLIDSPFPSVALRIALTAYEQEGAMIVAAAGNEGGEPAQIPARFPNVLGVSSNNIGAGLSCFSNIKADVAAPGGEGDASCNMDLIALCQGFSGDVANCPFAVISLIATPNPGFGYWAGTSMSTPLASGLAALVLEKCGGITPSNVRSMIQTNVTPSNVVGLGQGIVNVAQTLAQSCP